MAQIGLFYPHGTQINLNSTDPVSSDQSGQDHFCRRPDFGHVSHVSLGISSDFRVERNSTDVTTPEPRKSNKLPEVATVWTH